MPASIQISQWISLTPQLGFNNKFDGKTYPAPAHFFCPVKQRFQQWKLSLRQFPHNTQGDETKEIWAPLNYTAPSLFYSPVVSPSRVYIPVIYELSNEFACKYYHQYLHLSLPCQPIIGASNLPRAQRGQHLELPGSVSKCQRPWLPANLPQRQYQPNRQPLHFKCGK